MIKIYDESTDSFSLSFGGENEIDASLFASTMNNIVDLLQQITIQLEPEAYIKLKITSFQYGSFCIDLKAVISYIKNLLTKDNINMASTIIGTLASCFEIKKHLKGDKPKSIEYKGNKSFITNSQGEMLIKDKSAAEVYFGNAQVDRGITNIFNIMVLSGDRDSLVIRYNNNQNEIKIQKDEFANMAKNVINNETKVNKTLTNTIYTNLLLKKPDLLGNSKWGFIFDKSIEATIKDEEWLHRVHTGQIKDLYAGVKIPVKLMIECDFDEFMNPVATRYTVLEVTGDIIKPDDADVIK